MDRILKCKYKNSDDSKRDATLVNIFFCNQIGLQIDLQDFFQDSYEIFF